MKPHTIIVPLANGVEEIEAVAIIDILRRAGLEVIAASVDDESLDIEGAHGIGLVADATLAELDASAADAIVLPGGMTAAITLKADERVRNIAREFFFSGKLVAAICAAPIVLAAAGILDGRKATSYPTELDKLAGAICQKGKHVVVDGNLITGAGPAAAVEFALKIAETLAGADVAASLAQRLLANYTH